MMFYCWDKDPAERPSFAQLVKVRTISIFEPPFKLEQYHLNFSHFQDLEALLEVAKWPTFAIHTAVTQNRLGTPNDVFTIQLVDYYLLSLKRHKNEK